MIDAQTPTEKDSLNSVIKKVRDLLAEYGANIDVHVIEKSGRIETVSITATIRVQ